MTLIDKGDPSAYYEEIAPTPDEAAELVNRTGDPDAADSVFIRREPIGKTQTLGYRQATRRSATAMLTGSATLLRVSRFRPSMRNRHDSSDWFQVEQPRTTSPSNDSSRRTKSCSTRRTSRSRGRRRGTMTKHETREYDKGKQVDATYKTFVRVDPITGNTTCDFLRIRDRK